MTLVELALAAGIPARTLGAVEHGLRPLDSTSAARLAEVLGFAPDRLEGALPAAPRGQLRDRRAGNALVVALIGSLLVVPAPPQSNASPSAHSTAAPVAIAQRRSYARLSPAGPGHTQPEPTRARPTPTAAPATAAPSGLPAPAFRLEADGPHGCPLPLASGQIVITQGYSEGTHMPAETWGALDLGVDSDGDGVAEPSAVDGMTVVATHPGVAHVSPDSWPGGNFILVENVRDGWSTAYAHLASIAVADGQAVEAGAQLGTVGSTGMATGPHLHYEVRHGGVNLDPAGLIECGRH
jgi:murein DD-endopeptidase MepM/ murein hydrolase activator NlpD